MGAAFSFQSDQLAGAVSLMPNVPPTFSTSYGFDPSNTNNFGIIATISNNDNLGAIPVLTFPVAAGASTVSCTNFNNGVLPQAGAATNVLTCPIANTAIAPGTATIGFRYAGGNSKYTQTYAFLIAPTPVVGTDTVTSPAYITQPGSRVPETTVAATFYDSTETFTSTTTLTGASSTAYSGCPSTTISTSSSTTTLPQTTTTESTTTTTTSDTNAVTTSSGSTTAPDFATTSKSTASSDSTTTSVPTTSTTSKLSTTSTISSSMTSHLLLSTTNTPLSSSTTSRSTPASKMRGSSSVTLSSTRSDRSQTPKLTSLSTNSANIQKSVAHWDDWAACDNSRSCGATAVSPYSATVSPEVPAHPDDTLDTTVTRTVTKTRTICECDVSNHLQPRAGATTVLPAGYAGPDYTYSGTNPTPTITIAVTVFDTTTIILPDETSGTATITVDGGVTTVTAETMITDDQRTITTLNGCPPSTTTSEPIITP